MLASLRIAAVLLMVLPLAVVAGPIHVSGRVQIPAETVQGLAGARVELFPQTGDVPVAAAKSDAGGFFELAAPESGCFRLQVRAQGYVSVERPFLLLVEDTDLPGVPAFSASDPHARGISGQELEGWVFGDPTPKAVPPSPSAPRLVRGRVSDSKGMPVAGALVWSEGAPNIPCVKTGAEGVFEISLPARSSANDEAKLRAVGPGFLASDPRQVPPAGRPGPPLTLKLVPAGSITGRVVDAAGQPLARVRIEALPSSSTGEPAQERAAWSRADGRFRLSPLPPGKLYEVIAIQEGFAPASVKADALPSGRQPTPVRIVLERGATMLGKILDPEGKPVPGAELTLTLSEEAMFSQGLSWNGSPVGRTASGAGGSFAIPHLVPGRFRLRVTRKGFVPLSLSEVEVPVKTARIDLGALTLDRGSSVEGLVTDAAGLPLMDAEVELSPTIDPRGSGFFDTESFAEAQTDSVGHFRFEDLRRGARFDVSATHPGHVPARLRAVEAPTLEPLRIELKAGRTLAGRVKGPAGEPVPQAGLFLEGDPAAGQRFLGDTGEDGRFRCAGIEPGTVSLVVQVAGYQSARLKDVRIPEESDVEGLEITLSKASVLEIRAYDNRRQPVAGAWVTAHLQDLEGWGARGHTEVRTDDEGRCRLENLDLGRYYVSAESEKYGHAEASVEIGPGVNQRDLVFAEGVKVSGQVIDDSGAPVAGARLSLNPLESGSIFETASLADGSFQFPAVGDGSYHLSGGAPGFAEAAAPGDVQVAGRAVDGLVLRLSHGATLTGRVLGLDPEELASVSINAFREGEDMPSTHPFLSRTDREGRYKLTDLTPGDWKIHAQAPGRSVHGSLQIAPGVREAELDLQFPISGFTLTGRISADHVPLAEAQVWASSRGGSFQALTGPDGGFQIPSLPPGRYTLTAASRQEGLGTTATVDLKGDQEVNLDFATGGLRVAVFAGGAPVANALVRLSGPGPIFGRVRTTDGSGSLEVPRLASGSYRVFVEKEGFARATASVEIPPGSQASVRIELKPTP
jgi:protocatechuate 3,4-dioxygenase beta subunit